MKLASASEIAAEAWSAGWEPDPDLTVSQWAGLKRKLTTRASDEPGVWRNERTPYLVEIMDELSPRSLTQRVVFMKCSQIGGTECGNNWIGYVIDHAPGPMLMVQPSLDMVKRVVRQRIDPMIAESETLRERVAKPASRDGANNIYLKEFPGGQLIMTGANSAKSLRSMPIRYLFFDELDAVEHDIDGEGDPLSIAEKRTTNFSRRKIFLPSTPTIKGLSRIHRQWLQSDQRRYFVPCPHCGEHQVLRWRDDDGTYRLVCDRDAKGNLIPNTAKYLCEHCGVLIEERFKAEMLAGGRWEATAPGDGKTVGFHISALYSPLGWVSWAEIIEEFLEAKDFPEKLQVFVNTVLGEPFDHYAGGLDVGRLAGRLEDWPRLSVPEGVAVIVKTVDTQGDRLECSAIGFGAGEESWLIDYEIIWGDPGADETVWTRLEEWWRREYLNAAGRKLRAPIMLIDRGGHHADAVDRYVLPRQRRRVFAVVGRDYLSRPGLAMQSAAKKAKMQLWLIATYACKDRILSRLQIELPGPGYMHLPKWIPEQYLEQLTAEKKVIVRDRRRGSKRVSYVVTGRNEALDLTVYALAGLFILRTFIAPGVYTDLSGLRERIEQGQPAEGPPRRRRVRHPGYQRGHPL